jgi:hypothetical protein
VFSDVLSTTAANLLPPLNKNMYSHPVTAALPPLQPLVHGILQCRDWHNADFTGLFLSKDQTGYNMMMRAKL